LRFKNNKIITTKYPLTAVLLEESYWLPADKVPPEWPLRVG